MDDRGKLGNFLAQVINWRWDEFCQAEKDPEYTGLQSTVFSLVRTCSDQKLGAIKLAIDRVDGKIETPLKVEYPKIWFIFPEAKTVAQLPPGATPPPPEPDPSAKALTDPEPTGEEEDEEESAATMSLRQTLRKMADQPRGLTYLILKRKKEVEAELRESPGEIADSEEASQKIPLVKSVIAANLLQLAQQENFEAVMEVFDQIDGKLVETIKVLGEDIYISNYALEAPAGAVKNKNGVYVLEAGEVTNRWQESLKSKQS